MAGALLYRVRNSMADSPKAFVSYSWSSKEYIDLIRSYAERLVSDGVDVILDQWSLSEGQDKYAFMEQMVTDPSVTHVLVFSDRTYAEKANARRKGVGTESEIISRQVYEKTDQTKFIPLVTEMDDDSNPYLPEFLKSRIWIDFSSSEIVNANWEQLVRALHGRPLHEKPALGSMPSYLEHDDSRVALPTLGKLATLRDALVNSKPSAGGLRQEFLARAISYADEFRIRSELSAEELEARVEADLRSLLPLRDQLVDWVLLESEVGGGKELASTLTAALEAVLALKYRSPDMNRWNESWFDAQGIFVYEFMLYMIAALIKREQFEALRELLGAAFLLPEVEVYKDENFSKIDVFDTHSRVLIAKNQHAQPRRTSPIGDLIKERATRTDLTFTDVMQSELLLFVSTMLRDDRYWFPKTLVFADRTRFPLFVLASRHSEFENLAHVLRVTDANDLRSKFKAGMERREVNQWGLLFHGGMSFWKLANMEGLDSIE